MDVWTYFVQRERDFEEYSLAPDRSIRRMFWDEEGSEGQRGRIFGRLILTEDAFLQIHEFVEVQDDHVHRLEYGYFLVIEGIEVWGEERDPTHDPPVHRHKEGHTKREDSEPVSFKEAAIRAWDDVSKRT